MIRIALMLFKDYGLDVAQIGIISYFGWKIMTNHLKHIQDSITEIVGKLGNIETEMKDKEKRISFIEGKISK